MLTQRWSACVCLGKGLAVGLLIFRPTCVRAQGDSQRLRLTNLGLVGVSGYFFTDASGRAALGGPKFRADIPILARPRHLGEWELSGGLEIFSAMDHYLPFQGGNELSLIGPAFRLISRRVPGRVRPYLSGGLFVGRLRSVEQGFDRTDLTPSLAVGVEWPVARYITLMAAYRVSERIHGVNIDGFSLGLRLF